MLISHKLPLLDLNLPFEYYLRGIYFLYDYKVMALSKSTHSVKALWLPHINGLPKYEAWNGGIYQPTQYAVDMYMSPFMWSLYISTSGSIWLIIVIFGFFNFLRCNPFYRN